MDVKGEKDGQGRINQLLSWAGPRTVVVPRSPQGFGFTLRHFVVYPPEPATRPQQQGPEFYLPDDSEGYSGDLEPLDTIFVKTVREGSTAHLAGLTAGDRIVAVNGEPVSGKSYSDVISLIHSSHRNLKLLVVPRDEDILQMAYQSQSADSLSGSTASLSESGRHDQDDSAFSPVHRSSVKLSVTSPSTQRPTSQSPFLSLSPRHAPQTSEDMRGMREDMRGMREDMMGGRGEEAGGRMRTTFIRDDPGVPRRSPQSREPGGRPMSQDSALRLAGGVPSRTKYSFGLYFPPRAYPSYQSRAASADNLSRSLTVQHERQRTGSDTSGLQDSTATMGSRDTDFGARPVSKTPSPRHSYAQSGATGLSDWDRTGRENRYYVPVITQSARPSDSYSYGQARSALGERSHDSSHDHPWPTGPGLGGTVNVSTQPVSSVSDRSQRTGLGRPRDTVDGAGQSHTTFVVRIPVSSSAVTTSPQHSYGSSFAVTRSPRHTMIDVQRQSPAHSQHIEMSSSSPQPGTHIVEVQRSSAGPKGTADMCGRQERPDDAGDRSRIVLQRKVLFENGKNENNMPPGSRLPNRHMTELEKLTSQRKFASVATRMASFEKSSDEENDEPTARETTPQPQTHPGIKVRRVSLEQYSLSEGESQPGSSGDAYSKEQLVEHATRSEQRDSPSSMPGTAPVRIYVSPSPHPVSSPPMVEIVPVYQESQRTPVSDVRQPVCMDMHQAQPSMQPVQVVQPIVRDSNYMPSDSGYQTVHARPLSGHEWPPQQPEVEWQVGPSEPVNNNRPARKSSYLTAVNAPPPRYSLTPSPENDEKDEDEDDDEDDTTPTLYYPRHLSQPSVMSTSDSAVYSRPDLSQAATPTCSASVVLRKKEPMNVEDSMAKLHRRTSYLMATARDRSNNATGSTFETTALSPYSMSIPEEPTFTPVRQYSLNKLKNFFGEQTPSIVEAAERKGETPDSPLPDITREGPLWCKTSILDGKKCSDRSWKQVWAVLRGHALFFIKDRREGGAPAFCFEEQPVSIKSCLVDIAHDYSRKRKNVFRLTTYTDSVYLLQAEDKGTMMSWIQAIKTNNNPDNDEEGIGSAELIIRKVSTQSEGPLQTSPQTSHKEKDKEKDKDKSKKLSAISFKGKLPHSPSVRRKKTDEGGSSSSSKKGWKGRIMPRSFKKQAAEDGSQAGGSEPEEDLSRMVFGVPLEDCLPSPDNEYVPLIVELCTRIVEERGLEVVGVYRVPGNSVAVAHMQEELNRGFDNMNVDNEKWLDVNVVSSLLKAFFRKLPQPLVTSELYDAFIEANRNPNPEKRMLNLKRLIHTLPEHHYETFKHLAEHLSRVAKNGHLNKMDAKNLAIMFGPTLIRKVEDDTASLVTDMSDQCRIVESVILHNEWFFSNWTQDHYVPVDTHDSSHPSSVDTRVARDDDEDADSAINTKKIISSIVSAANKKRQLRQQNKSTDSLDADVTFSTTTSTATFSQRSSDSPSTTTSYQERCIDTAVQRSIALTKSQSSLGSSLSASGDSLDHRATAPLATSEPDFLDWEDRHKYTSRGRHMSDDALLERSDEVEVGGSAAPATLDFLKWLEQEARTIRQMEEQRQREMERCRRQQKLIERELQRSQRDLEMEDAHTVEDILAWPSSQDSGVTVTTAPPWTRSKPRTTFVPLTASDSKPLSKEPSEGRAMVSVAPQLSDSQLRGGKARAPSTTTITTTTTASGSGGGGKYFVSVANARDSQLLRPSSLENVIEGSSPLHVSRTGSLEDMVDCPQSQHQSGATGQGKGLGNTAVRHGSLDSLLDLIDRNEHHGDSDSEDGSDLLTSLTTTFDQKLQILLNPKYRLTARHTRIPSSQSRSPVNRTSQGSQLGDSVQGSDKDKNQGKEAGFRDPSLHRAAKSDPKIGIASRFEWGSNVAPPASHSAVTASGGARRSQLPDFRSFLSRTSRSDTTASSSVVLTQPRKLSGAQGQSATKAKSGTSALEMSAKAGTSRAGVSAPQGGQVRTRLDFRPISKSEKMEVNTALAKLKREEKEGVGHKSQDSTDSQTSSGISRQMSQPGQADIVSQSPASSSQSSQNCSESQDNSDVTKKEKERRKRRHTVGGAGDIEHFKALLAVSGNQVDGRPKSSAWEQLRPVSSQSGEELVQDRTLLSWLQKERLRGSTPDLLSCDLPPRQPAS